jgi:hypothetical protein
MMLAEQRRWLVIDRPMAETEKLNLQNVEKCKRETTKSLLPSKCCLVIPLRHFFSHNNKKIRNLAKFNFSQSSFH